MTAKLDRSWAHEMRGTQAGTKAGLQRRLHALLIKAAIAERAEREAVGEEGDVEEEESEQGLSSSLSEGEGEGQEGEESSSSHEALQRGTKRWRPGMPDSSDDEGPHQPQ